MIVQLVLNLCFICVTANLFRCVFVLIRSEQNERSLVCLSTMSRPPQPNGNDDSSNGQTYHRAPSQLFLSGGITVEVYHWSRQLITTNKYPVSIWKDALSTMCLWGVIEVSGLFQSHSRIKVLVKQENFFCLVSLLGKYSNENNDKTMTEYLLRGVYIIWFCKQSWTKHTLTAFRWQWQSIIVSRLPSVCWCSKSFKTSSTKGHLWFGHH